MTDHPHISHRAVRQSPPPAIDGAALWPEGSPAHRETGVLERLAAPERAVTFSIPYPGDDGQVRVVSCFFVQYCTALGPCRCALALGPGLTMARLRARALSLTWEAALAGLTMGGGAAGADIDPAALSRRESMDLCRRFMEALAPFLGQCVLFDGGIPARELGFLKGQQSRLRPRSGGWREPSPGGLRPAQATGRGLCFFAQNALRQRCGPRLDGQEAVISGWSGPAAWAGEKAAQLGITVRAIGGRDGYLYAPEGIPMALLRELGAHPDRPPVILAAGAPGVIYRPRESIWAVPADIYLLCDPEFPLDSQSALSLIAQSPAGIFEGADGACTPGASKLLARAGMLHSPAIASGAGAAAMWDLSPALSPWEADKALRAAMEGIFAAVWAAAAQAGQPGNLYLGARLAALAPIAAAMEETGL